MKTQADISCEILRAYEQVPDNYLILSTDLIILTVSDAFLKATFSSREEIVGKHFMEAFPEDSNRCEFHYEIKLKEAYHFVLANKQVTEIDVLRYDLLKPHEDGHDPVEKYWKSIVVPVLNHQHKVSYLIHKIDDVTDLVLKEQRLDDLEKEAQRDKMNREELLHQSEVVGHTGSYEVDLSDMRFRFSENLFRLLGQEPYTVPQTIEFIDSISVPEDVQKVKSILEKAISTGANYEYERRVFWPDGEMHYLKSKGRVICDKEGKPIKIFGTAHDETEYKQKEQKLKEEHRRLEDAQRLVRMGYFERKLEEEVFTWSDELYRIHGLEPQSEEITINRVLAFVHPDDQAAMEEGIAALIKTGKLFDKTLRIIRNDGKVRYVHRRAEVLKDEDGKNERLYGTVQDVTDNWEAAQQIEEQKLIVEAFNQTYTTGIQVFKSVRNKKNEIIDFEWVYTSKYIEDFLKIGNAKGKCLLEMFPAYLQNGFFDKYKHIVETGEALNMETFYECEGFANWFEVRAKKYHDGFVASAEDISNRKAIEKEFRIAKENLELALEGAHAGCGWWNIKTGEAKWDERGRQLIGFTNEEESKSIKNWLQRIHSEDRKKVISYAAECAKEGRDFKIEYRISSDGGELKYILGTGLVKKDAQGEPIEIFGLVFDITDQKRTEHALIENKKLLEAVSNTQPVAINTLRAIRDSQNQIVDMEWTFANSMAELKAGAGSLSGKKYLSIFPGEENSATLERYRQIIETGAPHDYEINYLTGKANGWWRNVAVKLGDGILLTEEDITKRKTAERELIKQYQVLKQAEEVARLGTWEYNIATKEVTWSEGMYRLFGLPLGNPVNLDTYLKFATEEDKPVAKRIVAHLKEKQDLLEETIRINLDKDTRIIRIKAVALRNSKGIVTKMLGIDMDVTEVKRLEEENLQIRLEQQKDLLLAILEAQEEERRRISEDLHNGVGQILYAAKINLDRFRVQFASQDPESSFLLKQTEQILKQAIRETRVLSHALAPSVLEQFGLEIAFKEIGSSLSSQNLQISCYVFNLPPEIEKFLQVAVYRMAQELANNIVKHARATEASMVLRKQRNRLLLQAEDNGQGFDSKGTSSKGIGIKSIRDRVELLNGTFKIKNSPGAGTQILISLPL
ncbi:PAS domain-containing protein [Pontibacter locisalis]|uniref:Oxygen sensor histidine kinase NreB n=1 Tax=Pontibacter locisalis TaxID=1719035 RepID=A0ABW5II30_9BACT